MAQTENPAQSGETLDPAHDRRMSDKIREWFMAEGAWWTASFVFHMLLMCAMMFLGTKITPKTEGETISIKGTEEANEPPTPPEKLEKFEVGETPIQPTELSTETLTLNQAPQLDASDGGGGSGLAEGGGTPMASGPVLGGLGGFSITAVGPGPAVRGKGGVGSGVGTGTHAGAGGSGYGFGGRGSKGGLVGGFGGTKNSERAVAAALNWIARHQMPNGSWNLNEFSKRCKGGNEGTCSGLGSQKSDSAATAMALLPFLAAGQTHDKRGPYKQTIYSGLYWLISNQKRDGNLSAGAAQVMYSHGLASICLCEAYGLSGDRVVGNAAQLAIDFIQKTQNTQHGGWRYQPTSTDGDTSVVGWMGMALKSAQMAYLRVDPAAFERMKKWLASVAQGNYKGLYAYTPETGAAPAMTSVGLLLQQYMGMTRDHHSMVEGVQSIMKNLPAAGRRQLYYWYYATQVMHNVPGPDWDNWNRKMRKVLIDTQIKDGCAAGSWDPARPTQEHLGEAGGRLAVTSLSTLTLEVYYRYLPLYKLDNDAHLVVAPAAKAEAEPPKPAPTPAAADKKPQPKAAAAPAEKKAEAVAKPGSKPAEAPKPEVTKPPAAAANKAAKPVAKKPDGKKPDAKPKADKPK